MADLDIVIPVFNEGENINKVLDALRRSVRTNFRVLICYDRDDDNTLEALNCRVDSEVEVVPVKNSGAGAHSAVLSGFHASDAAAVIMTPADDTANAGIIDEMVRRFRDGADIVVASRFMPGGKMVGCPWLKALLVRISAITLYHVAGLPTRDASNGLRLFSRRVLDSVAIESSMGFAYSIELLVKCHRLGWPIIEIPAVWIERTTGSSRFHVIKWLPDYLRWYFYAFGTAFLRRRRVSFRSETG
jgi:dolichol-phosphate mannosyltransferase